MPKKHIFKVGDRVARYVLNLKWYGKDHMNQQLVPGTIIRIEPRTHYAIYIKHDVSSYDRDWRGWKRSQIVPYKGTLSSRLRELKNA